MSGGSELAASMALSDISFAQSLITSVCNQQGMDPLLYVTMFIDKLVETEKLHSEFEAITANIEETKRQAQ